MPSAVERKELQQFPVVKEVSLWCQVGCLSCVLIISIFGWGLGEGANFHCSSGTEVGISGRGSSLE